MNEPLLKLVQNLSPEKRALLAGLLASAPEPIAIVGIGCRFPGGVHGPDAFWELLREGRNAITEVPPDRWDNDAYFDPDPSVPGRTYVRHGGFIGRADEFDAEFFGILPVEARRMDPLQRLLLEVAWEALEHGGQSPTQIAGSETGVFIGMGDSEYMLMQVDVADPTSIDDAFISTGCPSSMGPGRLSYLLDLKGPSVAVDTACSSSLVAVHLACQSLRQKECSMALAGGVNLILSPVSTLISSKLMAMAPDGRCKAFAEGADGFVRGEGCGVIVLKRLSDALAAGDNVLALILGSAVNQDGKSSSLTAPNGLAQQEVVEKALASAGVAPARVGYVEAHGTGTALGDPIEVQALGTVLGKERPKEQPFLLGSVKANIGHLETAAGVASLIKAVLCLQHGEIPAQLHVERLNQHVLWDELPVTVPTALTKWTAPSDGPRIAGVSSFGFSGTNAHIVLQQAPAQAAPAPSRAHQLLTLSARTPQALEQLTDQLVEHLERHPEQALADVAYTSTLGRAALPHRRTLVCRDPEDAIAALKTRDPKRLFTALAHGGERPVVFMFPGLGEQYVGMGLELYRTEPVFREHLDACAALLATHLRMDIRSQLYPEGERAPSRSPSVGLDLRRMVLGSGGAPEEDAASAALNRTVCAQPAIFAIEYALARLLMAWGIQPKEMIGYSIGEYVAACLASVLSLADAAALVARRALVIQELPAGAMLGVPLPREEILPLLGEELSLSGSNTPSLGVVAGPEGAIQAFERALTAKGVPYRRLRTTHAFHSKMMTPAAAPLLDLVRRFELSPPKIPYLSNVTGTWITPEQATSPDYWAAHLCQEVRFSEGIAQIVKRDRRVLLEVGPGQTLCSFAMQQPQDAAGGTITLPTLRSSYDRQPDVAFLQKTLGRLWQIGVPIDGRAYYAGESRRRVPLPTYPFDRRPHWFARPQAMAAARGRGTNPSGRRPLDQWFYTPSFKRANLPATLQGELGRVLLFADAGQAAALSANLRERGAEVITVAPGLAFTRDPAGGYTIDPRRPEDYRSLFGDLWARGVMPSALVHTWMIAPEALDPTASEVDRALDFGFYSLVFAVQAIDEVATQEPMRLVVFSTGLQAVTGDEELHPARALVLGPCKVIPQEYRSLSCSSVDVEPSSARPDRVPSLAERIVAELRAGVTSPAVAYRGAHRWEQTFEPAALQAARGVSTRLRPGGVYLITGGLGGVGLALAEYMAREARVKLVLVGRAPLPAREDWDAWFASHEATDPTSHKLRQIRALEALGAEVLALSADVSDATDLTRAIEQARARFGKVHGVIHAAGEFGGNLIQLKTREEMARVLAPKVRGALLLEQLLRDAPPDFFVVCSSLTGVVGGPGQVDYVAANAFLDAFAQERAAAGFPALSINWDDWKDVGAAFKIGGPRDFVEWRREHYKLAMRTEEGVEVFRRAMESRWPQVLVSTRELAPRMEELDRMTAEANLQTFGQKFRTGRQRPALGNTYVAPRSDLERRLVEIWQSLLNVEPVGVHDDFSELGGHSLVATQLVGRLREAFRVDFPLRRVFEAPTIAELGRVIEEHLVARVQALAPEEVERRLSAQSEAKPAREAALVKRYTLPNGMEIRHQSKAETDHFYDDIFVKHVYYKNGIRLDEGAVVLDVGANIGMFTLFVGKVCPSARVYSFEPAPPVFEILRENVERHGVRATLLNQGVSDRPKTAELTFYPNSSGMSSFHADLEEEQQVFRAILANQVRGGVAGMGEVMDHLDDLVQERFRSQTFTCRLGSLSEAIREHALERIDLVKIDVQKCELEVLAGIDEADWPRIQQMAIEVHDIDGGLARARSMLEGHGFSVIAEQDDLYEGSPIYNVYAVRPGRGAAASKEGHS
ncbi:type I polyketide synthase [Polyangium sp. 15x6]|uniref:type I polyketide synthase n=1 Tax=Polyangium sp. 15x6 TaxID=3042687 RepID=UPI00249C8D6A|nr:type I polyketide synthase [Polyangium sp. 15x6]MDI3287046.1 FkbM family methyltransferase [Polyangium sp. 15x6]